MKTATNYQVIEISVDNVWAGSGKLIDGTISDCGAQFGDNQDESEKVYELIEESIEDGKDEISAVIGGERVSITWSIIEPS